MKAAVITERGALPVKQDFKEPEAQDGAIQIDVETAGLGGWDVLGAYRLGVAYPCVIRGEGVGRTVESECTSANVLYCLLALGPNARWSLPKKSGMCRTISMTAPPSPWVSPQPAR